MSSTAGYSASLEYRVPRFLLLITADARGHLMRGQLLYHALRARGAEVSVLTTSDAGQAFLREFGVPAEVLSSRYAVQFDTRQKMRTWATDLRVTAYLFLPWNMLWDGIRLARLIRRVDLVVNDSFHPALLVMGGLDPWRKRVVHVYGWSLRESLERNFMGRIWGPLARFFRWWVGFGLARARGRLVHDFAFPVPEQPDLSQAEHHLPTPIAGINPESHQPNRKVAVYLNPHFSDPALAQALEEGLREAGEEKGRERDKFKFREESVFLLGEGYAGRPGWHPYATDWIDVAARAELLISAPGMGALSAAQALGKPIILIVTAQPEQQRNAARASSLGLRHRVVGWNESTSGEEFCAELKRAYRELMSENQGSQGGDLHPAHAEGDLKERLHIWVRILMDWASRTATQGSTASTASLAR